MTSIQFIHRVHERERERERERESERELLYPPLFLFQAVLPECCTSDESASRASPDENSYYNGSPPEEKVTVHEELVS